MKKLLYPLSLILTAFLILYSCSPEEETKAPTSTFQSTTPKPEPETPAPLVVQYTLTVTTGEGGNVSSEGGTYDEGTNVTVTATPSEGYEFIGWEGSSSTSESLIVTLNSNQAFQAIFEIIPIYTLTVTTGEGGAVSLEGGKTYDESPDLTGLNSDDYIVEDPNILIGKYARKPIENGYHEVEIYNINGLLKWRNKDGVTWSLELKDGKLWAGPDCDYGEQVLGVFTENNQNVLALFFNNENYERVGDTSISNSAAGSEITITVTANEGYEFIGWEGSDETTNNINITLTADTSLTALIQSTIYLDNNGTCKCANASVGDTATISGTLYTVVDNSTIAGQIANGNVNLCTTLVTNMNGLFKDNSSFNQNIGGWDTSKVVIMRSLFEGATSFNKDIGSWDTSNVSDMHALFKNSNFNKPISDWDVSKVEDMGLMFSANSANSPNPFNQDISSWDTSSVTSLYGTFLFATSFDQDIGGWDVSNVFTMDTTFANAESFNQDLSSWDTSSVQYMTGTFSGAKLFNQNIGNWNTSNVQYMSDLFWFATVFDQDLSGWCVTNITSEPSQFSNNSALTNANKPLWGTCPP
jgi:surface protein